MMAKDEDRYIKQAISELQKEVVVVWELIVIDDHSEDDTYRIVNEMSRSDDRVRLYKNPYKGKVLGTNYGYSLSRGEIIKCIDADDILLKKYFEYYEDILLHDAYCHDALVTNSELEVVARYTVNPKIFRLTYEDIISRIVSIPKWSWSFKRSIGDKIFPMPESLPLEDEWISFLIKKHCKSIGYANTAMYLYRQNYNQDYGGILNYSIENVVFRASRLTVLIDVIRREHKELLVGVDSPFVDVQGFLRLQIDRASIISILKSSVCITYKIKSLLVIHFPRLSSFVIRQKWILDKWFR